MSEMAPTYNIDRVTRSLLVGGGMHGQDEVDYLRDQGVTHLVSMAVELDDAPLAAKAGIGFLHIPWSDNGQQKDVADFLALYHFIAGAIEQGARSGHAPVFAFHCAAGHNRGPLGATFALAVLSGLPGDGAFAIVKAARPVATSFEQPAYRASCLLALDTVYPFRPVTVAPESVAAEPATAEGDTPAGADAGVAEVADAPARKRA